MSENKPEDTRAIETIRAQLKQIVDLRAELDELRERYRWRDIFVNGAPPEPGVYLAIYKEMPNQKPKISALWFYQHGAGYRTWERFRVVTHWMPLPEPPVE